MVDWNIDMPNLVNGGYMFYQCSGLTVWNADLPSLIDSSYMF